MFCPPFFIIPGQPSHRTMPWPNFFLISLSLLSVCLNLIRSTRTGVAGYLVSLALVARRQDLWLFCTFASGNLISKDTAKMFSQETLLMKLLFVH